jgi:sugar-specific transcriptional regulator TrmB
MTSQLMNRDLSPQDKEVQTLVNLGLTVLQAKVYTALAKSGTSTGRMTAKMAQVASQDVYRILNELQERGLVEKIITKPAMYEVASFKDGISALLQNKKEEYIEVEKQVQMMTNYFCETKNQNALPEKLQFIMFSDFTPVKKKWEKLADMAKRRIDIVAPLKINEKNIFHDWPYINRAIRRGVKIRIIAKKANGESSSKPLSKNPLFELRYLPEVATPFGIHIFDEQEVTLALSENPLPGLWTDNPNVIELAETYFEKMWNNTQPINP